MFANNLKNRFRLIIFSMVALLLSIAVIVVIGIRHTNEHIQEATALDVLVIDLYELRILNSEYVVTPSERVKQQWMLEYDQIKNKISHQQVIPEDVKDALDGLQLIFGRLASMREETDPSQKRLRDQLATTLNLESQRLIDWASDISRQTKDRVIPHLMLMGAIMLAVMLVVAFATIITMLVTTRRVLSSLNRIKNGAVEIAGGNLGFLVEYIGNDEIASLATAINQMSRDLNVSYENLHDQTVLLETEMAEKQIINEALQVKTVELEKEIEERQMTQQGLEEQTVLLEEEVTERIRIQEEHDQLEAQLRQSQKMEAIGLLAGGVAHDFNNIISVIMGYGDLLIAGLPEGNMHDDAVQILKASERAAELTRSLLLFSRKQEFYLEMTNIKQLASDSSKFLKRIIGEDIELVTEYDQEPLITSLDRSQIQQVFMNLATNARDAMPSGGKLTIDISSKTLDEHIIALQGYGIPGNYAVIHVRDTGAGMDNKTVERIFEPFYTTKEKGKGTGLGLSIIHGIIAQHNGFIHCLSDPGVGTTFTIYLPLCKEHGHVTTYTAERNNRVLRGTETILLAEDDAMLLEFTTNTLEANGYRVIQARDGSEAVAMFTKYADNIDLVVLDAIMPKMTGKQAWDKISEIRPDVKACFVSGYTHEIMSGKLAVDFRLPLLSKPIMPEVLLQKLREILDK